MTVHPNSAMAYHDINLTARQFEVVEALQVLGKATDQQIADFMEVTINRVTGRITELRDKKVLTEIESVDGEFGKKVRVCRLVDYKGGLW